jgi:type I restriction enzyme S subunit
MFPRGTIFMSIAANIGDVAISGFDAACPDSVVAVKPRNGFDPEWLFQSLKFSKNDLAALSTQNAQANLSLEKIEPFKVPVPPLPEQRKIAEILRTWDEALEKLTALRTSKQGRLTGLMQQIIGRGGVFPDRWPLKPLSAVASPIRRTSAGDNHPVMTISAKSGFLMQSDKFARDMAGQSVDRYTLLHEGEFAYNKGNSKTAPYGCVFRLDRPTALVPFVYYCFALKSGLDPEFYKHLFAAGALNHQLSRLINSGVRNDGLLNLYSEDFYNCRVPVPPIDEQRKIARALTAAKQELALIDDEIEALTRQKRGLMQKLLTGEWRVNLKSDQKEFS